MSGNLQTITSQDGQGRSVDKVHRVKARRCRAFPSHYRVYVSTKEYSVKHVAAEGASRVPTRSLAVVGRPRQAIEDRNVFMTFES